MIKTAAKAKIGKHLSYKHLSYPFGAQVISASVGSIPQEKQTEILFLSTPIARASEFNRILCDGDAYRILECRIICDGEIYNGISDNLLWQIAVYPVARELKSDAKKALEICGLPKLKDFLWKTAPSQGKRELARFIAFNFDPVEKRVMQINR